MVYVTGALGQWATTHATMKSATTSRGCEWEAQRNALATVRRFNATLSAKGYVWFWPKIAAALFKTSLADYRLRQLRHRD